MACAYTTSSCTINWDMQVQKKILVHAYCRFLFIQLLQAHQTPVSTPQIIDLSWQMYPEVLLAAHFTKEGTYKHCHCIFDHPIIYMALATTEIVTQFRFLFVFQIHGPTLYNAYKTNN